MESNMEISQKSKNRTIIYLKEYAPGYDRATCISMFIAALLTIAKLQK
jgi:hypothetical protein